MDPLVTTALADGIATVTVDDGKVNAMTLPLLDELGAALERAAAEQAVVVLAGRPGVFSAGFHLGTLTGGGPDAPRLLRAGFETTARILALPVPVIVACTGHAIALGAFLLLSGDERIGAAGDFRITANEVAIGMPVPLAAVEICRQRLTPAHCTRSLLLAEVYDPDAAVAAGYLDRVVPPGDVLAAARAAAERCRNLDLRAHAESKRRARAPALAAIAAGIDADEAAFRARLAGAG
jgi:enoyl-CoA hydratase